jgi:hypothetical protein
VIRPAPLSERIERAVSLQPMSVRDLSRCLCASTGAIRRAIDRAVGVDRVGTRHEGRFGPPAALIGKVNH